MSNGGYKNFADSEVGIFGPQLNIFPNRNYFNYSNAPALAPVGLRLQEIEGEKDFRGGDQGACQLVSESKLTNRSTSPAFFSPR